MGKKRGGGGGNDDARRRQEEDNRRRQQEENNRRQRDEQTRRQAEAAKEKAREAQRQTERDRERDRNGGGNGGGMVKQAVAQVGDKLKRSEVKDLRQQGYSLKQVQKVAGKVDKVGAGAARHLDKWQRSYNANPNNTDRPRSGGGGTPPAGGSGGGGGGGERRNPENRPAGAVSAGGAQGTSDRNGWLAAELNAIDTFRANTTPTVFNNYRPTDLSDQLRDAVAEANQFIDSRSSGGSGTTATASVQPSALRPQSLLDQDEYQRWGLGLVR